MEATNPDHRPGPGDRSLPLRLSGDTEGAEHPLTVALMAGGFSPPPLAEAACCSLLDLFVAPGQRLSDHWHASLRAMDRSVPTETTLCLCGGSTPLPRSTLGSWRTILDETDYRGPAGALRDAVANSTPRDSRGPVLAIEAGRVCSLDLASLVAFHRERSADVTIGVLPGGSPAGVYMLERSMLDAIPEKGFMDLKEQYLDRLVEKGAELFVHRFESGSCRPARRLREYIEVIAPGCATAGVLAAPQLVAARGASGSLICDGAEVSPDAVVVNSVVMPSGRVEPGATVVRSLVCEGCVVPGGLTVIDKVVGPRGVISDDEASRPGDRRIQRRGAS
ncbi:MAG: hypothetical protein ACF8LK_04805 [Phycisphaerales bacterium JB041]